MTWTPPPMSRADIYEIVRVLGGPEMDQSALGARVTIRTYDDGCALCAGSCGELVPIPDEGDALCEDCALLLIPADVRAMRPRGSR